ncbi:MAG TPA: tRNA (adenosine(37)-N6)-dimethylallyltransferase MiaA [Candidatus Dormibacteraeota bacterium]|nr:tRNA (adenosine(37)-N6)-dimethylallyltransferase MiaA [Candidatus Dormibacteraeota bacterium]
MTAARPILAIGGPTATGKTALAVEVALRLGGELVNADSRQLMRRLLAGTARPTEAEMRGVPCHLLAVCEPGEPYTVAQWLEAARGVLDDVASRGVPPILVGGTGQYLRALRQGWTFGGVPPVAEAREEITAVASTPSGLHGLVAELRERDPDGAAAIDLANPRRVIRALEVLRGGTAPLAVARGRSEGRSLALVVLDADREWHRCALASRLDAMFSTGAIQAEVGAELDAGSTPGRLARAGIGYREAVAVLEGSMTVDEAVASVARRTRRYVKAQRTWFRHEPALLRLERSGDTPTSALADQVLAGLVSPGGWPC